jgi:phage shock protein A
LLTELAAIGSFGKAQDISKARAQMSIFKRIQDIISANLNDLVEGYENPEQMLRQAIREMEYAIHRVRPDVARAMANEKAIAKELAANEAQAKTWDSRAVAAVQAGDEPLARKALQRKLEYERIAAALKDQCAAAQESSQMLRRQLAAVEAKLADAQRRLCTLVALSRAADIRVKMANADVAVQFDHHNAFAKFDRLTRKVERAEAEADAMAELARSSKPADDGVESEFVVTANVEIDAELAALKERVHSSQP